VIPGARKRKGQIETRRTLHADVVTKLGKRAASEVTRKDVVELIVGIIDRGAKVQAGNVLRELSSAYEFAIGNGKFLDTFANPALLAKASLRQTKVKLTSNKGRRVFSDDELAQFLSWLPTSAYRSNHKSILKLTLWTGCRTGEICAIKFKDIDLDNSTLHIRETKTGAERYVQLPSQAIEFLKTFKPENKEFVFESNFSKSSITQKTLSEHSWALRVAKKMLNIDPWTPHDLRRTVRTGLSKLQCPSEVAEAVLGHARKGIEGTYDLHSYDQECRVWLQHWADHMDSLENTIRARISVASATH
jgi:integrase